MPEMIVPWSLLQRVGSLFDALGWVLKGPSEAAAWIVARSLADMAITISWLRVDPATRVKLWTAEAERRDLEVLSFLQAHSQIAESGEEPPHVGIERKCRIVAEARRLAREAGAPGRRANAPLIPNLQARAEAVGTDATLVAYKLFFGPWSE